MASEGASPPPAPGPAPSPGPPGPAVPAASPLGSPPEPPRGLVPPPPPRRGPSGGYGLFVVLVVGGYLVFSSVSLVASLKAHSRQSALASGAASENASAPPSTARPPTTAAPQPSASAVDDLFAVSDACLKQIKASDWEGARKTCEDGLQSAKDPKVMRALHYNLAAISRHDKRLDAATKSYLDALTFDYTDEVREALSQVSTWKAVERRADATVTGKKSSTATLFKQPGTKSEKVKALAFGVEVKTMACVSGGKDTWCAAVVSGGDGEGERGWIAQSRLDFSNDKDKDEK